MLVSGSLVCCLLLFANVALGTPGNDRVLYALDRVPSEMTRHDVDAKITATDRGKALAVDFHKSDWPNVYFSPAKETWDWSSASGLAVDIYNPESNPMRVYVRVDNAGADGMNNCAGTEISAAPKAWSTLRLYFNTGKPVLWGMRGLPGIGPAGSAKQIDLARITAFQLFLNQPKEAHSLTLSSFRLFGHGGGTGADVPMPFVDRFGQYEHADWPGKLNAESELARRAKAETTDLASHPVPSNRDGFGGWADGPKLAATGWFRTQQVNGKWWLVTPEGHPFFSVGVDCVVSQQQTFVEKREKWFEWLPAGNDPSFGSLYGSVSGAHSMAEPIDGKGRTYSFYTTNLIRKYGADWAGKWRDSAYSRLKSWGFNTVANWSQGDVLENSPMPFVACAHITSGFRHIEGGRGYWGNMPDVYDPKFAEAAEAAIRPVAARYNSNNRCIGYFVDNEPPIETIDWATLASPADQPCRVAFIKQLAGKYSTIEALNKAWGTSAKSWDELRAPGAPTDSSRADLGAFTYAFARRYFDTVRTILRKHDANHLYLGCRFAGAAPKAVVRACADVVDVVSYNIYEGGIECSRFTGENDLGKPIIIGEFHFGAMDRGMFHPGLADAGTQQGRADAYARYVRSAADCPAIVGCHWFQYVDEPITGRCYDGENYNIGFVDVTDTPYPELVTAARKANAEVYTRRGGKLTKDTRPLPSNVTLD